MGQIDTGAKAAELEAVAGRIVNNNASTRPKSTDAPLGAVAPGIEAAGNPERKQSETSFTRLRRASLIEAFCGICHQRQRN